MYRITSLLIFMIFASLTVLGQEEEQGTTPAPKTKKTKKKKYNQPEFEDVLYNKEFTIGLKAHTNGFGLSAHFIKIKNRFKRRVLEIQVMDLKNPKEKRSQSNQSFNGNSAKGYVFGKQNNFYNINASLGVLKAIAEKGRKSGVAFSLYYAGGVSLGITKPYYLDLVYSNTDIRSEKYVEGPEGNANFFLNQQRIFGSSGFAAGLNEIGFVPGVQGKVALHFDWANNSEFIKALEVGAMVNGYIKRVPILVSDEVKNNLIYVNLYARLLLGKRS